MKKTDLSCAPPTRDLNPGLIDLGGSIVIPAGRALVTDTTLATGATSIQFSFMWEEIPI